MNLTLDVLDRIIVREKAKLSARHGDDNAPTTGVAAKTQPIKPEPIGHCEFIHLHVHTDYSILDGMCRISELVKKAKDLGMPAVAMTDHGNMSGAIKFYQAARAARVKPIIGCEVYYVPDMKMKDDRETWHLVLLAKDVEGYKNLMKITSAGYTDGFHYKPRVDLEFISSHSGGLIATTACVRGYVPALLLNGNSDKARDELGKMKDIFGPDLYIELMNHGLPEQKAANPELVKLGREFNVPVVATNDCHYINAEDAVAHDVLLCIQTGKKLADEDRLRFGSDQFYVKTQEEMTQLFPEEHLKRTLEVAEKCDLELELNASHMPVFTTPDGSTPEEYLRKRMEQGVYNRFGSSLDTQRKERLSTEYEVIKQTGFASYFLIIDDMVQYAQKQGIRIGPGRGSAVASLVCYVLGITDVEPITHNLLFERFLTEDRVSPPDIDIDFSHDRREEVMDYLRQKYGHTAQITTFNRLSSRSLLRDVGKAFGISQPEINEVATRVPSDTDKTLTELCKEVPELAEIDKRVIDIGTRLHGIIRHSGKHPGGIVISDKPLTNSIPLCISGGIEMTQFDKDDLEACGILKLDALGNSYLTIIDVVLENIEQRYGIKLENIPMDDTRTYNLICSGNVYGIFQLGQECGRDLVGKMQPRNFTDLIHLISLGRPGVLNSGLVDEYLRARQSGEAHYLHPKLETILEETLGVMLYQEQIMQIAVELAGFSWKDSDKLRKAIGKKDMKLMVSMRERFLNGCAAEEIPEDIATKLWENISFFGGYGFNKAHAAGYAMLTCQTAYLKANYPLEYTASLLSVKCGDEGERKQYILEAKRCGISILPPDINTSTGSCNIQGDTIHLPLTAVSMLAEKACDVIVNERDANGEFISYADFCARLPKKTVNERIKENLVKAGAFDILEDRGALLERVLGTSVADHLAMEREVLGMYISGHPLDSFPYDDGTIRIGKVAKLSIGSEFKTIGIVDEVTKYIDKNGNQMAFVTISDESQILNVVVFASLYRGDIEIGDTLHLHGELEENEPLKSIAIEYETVNINTVTCCEA